MMKDKGVFVKINSIKEICFSQNNVEATPALCEELKFSFGFSLAPHKESDTIDLTVGVRYQHHGKMVLECQYSISFLVHGLEQVILIEQENSFKAEDSFISYLLGIGVNTLRGIVVVKTAGTPLNDCPVPIINPDQLVKNTKTS